MSADAASRNELWKQYMKSKSPELREKIILEYAYLVKYVAGRLSIYFGNNVDYDDLIGYGIFGLIDAIDKYDINKGVKFETYASLRIRGAILDSIRELDWVPRSLRQKNRQLEKVYAELESELGRAATDEEAAERMGMTLDEFNKFLDSINVSTMISLEEFLEQKHDAGLEDRYAADDSSPEAFAERSNLRDILADSIDKLPEKERMVITLYYYEELTLKEISAIMKVSESRISQLHTRAIARMRGKLARHKSLL